MTPAAAIPAAASVPAALAVAAALVWYWRRLGDPQVPESRRRIRRSSLAVMLCGLPILVWAVSFTDAETNPGRYVITWLLVIFTLGLMFLTAGLDLINTARLGRRERRRIRAAALRPGKGGQRE